MILTINPDVVYVKYETDKGVLKIDKHIRPALLGPTEQIDDFIRDLVLCYKSDPTRAYLGLADEDEYAAFNRLSLLGIALNYLEANGSLKIFQPPLRCELQPRNQRKFIHIANLSHQK